ncbi:hypothetical protein U3516DRAFT_756437 [Neocallimastix sp. 'constans']
MDILKPINTIEFLSKGLGFRLVGNGEDFVVELSDFASYDSKSQSYILETGSFILEIQVPCAATKVPYRVTAKKVKNQIGNSLDSKI